MTAASISYDFLVLLIAIRGAVLLACRYLTDLTKYSSQLNYRETWSPNLRLLFYRSEAGTLLVAGMVWLGVVYIIYRGMAPLSYYILPAVLWFLTSSSSFAKSNTINIVSSGVKTITIAIFLVYFMVSLWGNVTNY